MSFVSGEHQRKNAHSHLAQEVEVERTKKTEIVELRRLDHQRINRGLLILNLDPQLPGFLWRRLFTLVPNINADERFASRLNALVQPRRSRSRGDSISVFSG